MVPFEAMKLIQRPADWRDKSLVKKMWTVFDPDFQNDLAQDEQIDSGKLISVHTKRETLKNTI